MATDLDLCNMALISVGAAPISSFSDPQTEAIVASRLYAVTRDQLLSRHPWGFAQKQVALTPVTSTPEADYSYQFELPADFLAAISVGSSGSGQGLRYRIVGDTMQANATQVVLTYSHKAAEDLYPPFFAHALMLALAAAFCIPLTENTARAAQYNELAETALREAKRIDSQQDTPLRMQADNLLQVRWS